MQTARHAVLAALIALAAALPAASAPRLRVAVLPFSSAVRLAGVDNVLASRAITGAFAYFLNDTGRFETVPLPDPAPADVRSAVRSLRDLSLDYVVQGQLEGDSSGNQASVAFIRATGPGAGSTARAVRAVSLEGFGPLAYSLAERAAAAFPAEGRVLMTLSDGRLLVSLTAADGLHTGDAIELQEPAEELKDPATGEVLYRELRTVGRAQVLQAQEKSSLCRLYGPARTVTAGTSVRTAPPPAAAGRTSLVLGLGRPRFYGGGPAEQGEAFADQLAAALALCDAPYLSLREPQLDAVLSEIRLCESTAFDWSTTVKAGSVRGVSTLVVPIIDRQGSDYVVSARLDDVVTGQVLVTGEARGRRLSALAPLLATEIARVLEPLAPEDLGAGLPRARVVCEYEKTPLPTTQYACLRRLGSGLVRWALENPTDRPCVVRLTTDLPGYTARPYTLELDLPPHETRRGVGQAPPLLPAALQGLKDEATPAQVKCVLELVQEGRARTLLDRSYEVKLLRPGIWVSRLQALDLLPTVALLARDSETLVKVRGQAAALVPGGLTGYQADAAGVRAQVAALYAAVAMYARGDGGRGVRYADQSAVSFPPRDAQRVLTPEETLAGGGANCLDSSVLFAALLAPVLDPILILTDTHAYVGWRTAADSGAPYEVVETTCLGSADFPEAAARARALAQKLQLAELLKGRLDFSVRGELNGPVEARSLPGVQAVISVRQAQSYFQAGS